MENHTLPTGFLLKNKYTIKQLLGQGGFGITYLAYDDALEMDVCIKELFISGSSTRGANMTVLTQNLKEFSFADFKERFMKEAMQLARFNHRNIVRVLEYFESNNTAYLVMEYLNGETLKEKVQTKGPLGTEQSKKIIESILDGVEQIHNAGMLHRDIKPDNLIIGNDGRVVLIDFGSARAYSDDKTITQTAMVSPGYAPLEQYNPTARKGAFTDIYSIGATFYFMLTGVKPLNVTERYSERMKAPHEINPNVSMQVSSAVMLAMEMKAEDRFQNIQDFRIALSMLSSSKPFVETPKSNNNTPPQPPKAKTKKSSGSSVLGGCLIAFLILSLLGVIGTVVVVLVLNAAIESSGSTQQTTSYEPESNGTSVPEPAPEINTETRDEEPKTATYEPNTYYGNLAGNDITVKINGFENFIEGSYFYNEVGRNITLMESYRNDEEIEIKEYTNGNYTGVFNFPFFYRDDNELDGYWTSTDGSRTYRVTLYRN